MREVTRLLKQAIAACERALEDTDKCSQIRIRTMSPAPGNKVR
jgi:hypothetical protein